MCKTAQFGNIEPEFMHAYFEFDKYFSYNTSLYKSFVSSTLPSGDHNYNVL